MTVPGSRKTAMAMTAIMVLPDKALGVIDMARVDTSLKCKGSMRDATIRVIVAVEPQPELVEVETQDVVITRTTVAVVMLEVAQERTIVGEAVEEEVAARAEVEVIETALSDTRVLMTMALALGVTTEPVSSALEVVLQAGGDVVMNY